MGGDIEITTVALRSILSKNVKLQLHPNSLSQRITKRKPSLIFLCCSTTNDN